MCLSLCTHRVLDITAKVSTSQGHVCLDFFEILIEETWSTQGVHMAVFWEHVATMSSCESC